MLVWFPGLLSMAVIGVIALAPLWRRRRTMKALFVRRKLRTVVASGSLIVLISAAALALVIVHGDRRPSLPRAVIVDELALTDPNPGFVGATEDQLRGAGYEVDYVPPDRVTVDFYKSLPSRGYKVVVLRSHAAELVRKDPTTGVSTTVGDAGLFTNELYSTTSHVTEQYQSVLGIGSIPQMTDHRQLFTVGPSFVSAAAVGRFDRALIVLMGCAGIKTTALAEAFITRGAAEFISWDDSVTAAHTDLASAALLRHLLRDQDTASEAVARTMQDVGPDPTFGARLKAYP